MLRRSRAMSWRILAVVTAVLLIPQSFVGATGPRIPASNSLAGADTPVVVPGAKPLVNDEESEDQLLALDFAMLSRRLAGDTPLTIDQAAALRVAAARQAQLIRQQGLAHTGPATFGGAWSAIGPRPIGEVTRTSPPFIAAMNGRI